MSGFTELSDDTYHVADESQLVAALIHHFAYTPPKVRANITTGWPKEYPCTVKFTNLMTVGKGIVITT